MVTKSRAAALVCLLLGLGMLGSAASAAATTLTVAVSADTYTASNAPATNYGTSWSLGVYKTPVVTTALRVVLPPTPAGKTLTGAKLRLRTTTVASAGSANPATVRLATDTWTEAGTTYANRPTPSGAVLGTLPGGTVANTAYSVTLDTATLARRTGATTLAIEGTGSDSLWLWSREASAANRPALDLTWTDTQSPPPDTTAPSTPTGLTVNVNSSSVALAWTASTDDGAVTGYTVHRSATANFTPDVTPVTGTAIGTATNLGYSDQNRPAGTWYYRVVANDAAGNASDPSASATAVIAPVDTETPTKVSVSATADTYTASSSPTSNYGTSSSLGAYKTPVVTAVLRFVLPVAPPGKTLTGATLKLRTTTVASAGSANPASVRLATDGWAEAGTTYANRPTPSGAALGTLAAPATNTPYAVSLDAAALSSLTGSTTLAVEGGGTDSLWLWSREASASYRPVLELTWTGSTPPPPADTEPPTAPSDLSATVTGTSVKLDWSAAQDDRGVTTYVVHRSSSPDFSPTADSAIGTTAGTTTTDSARPQGTWHYLVVARDEAGNTSSPSAIVPAEVTAVPEAAATVVATGDIVCPSGSTPTATTCKHPEVRSLIDSVAPDRFVALGDIAYEIATYQELTAPGGFGDTFGSLGDKILPVLGNHEAYDPQANGYWDYFYGPGVTTGRLGARPLGYYATMIGGWRFIGLNSECDAGGLSGGCGVGSPQYEWLRSELESHVTSCTVVAFHKPRWTTGAHTPYTPMAPMWDLMAQHGVDIALTGHNHVAETFKPIGVSGAAAQPTLSSSGVRSFTVGIGGKNHAAFQTGASQFSALESRAHGTFGVLKLTLKDDGYGWAFLPIQGSSFVNSGTSGSFSGSDSCH